MRKLLITILLASGAATPALAGPRDFTDRPAARAERQQSRDDARAERQQSRDDARAARSSGFAGHANVQPPQQQSVDRSARIQDNQAGRAARNSNRESLQADRAQRIDKRQQIIGQRQQTTEQIRANRALHQSTRPLPNVMRTRVPVVSDVPRIGTQPPLRIESRRAPQVQWNTSWRNDNHYNWQDYRRHHRSQFHLGFYYDPYGWGYQPYSIGWRLWPSYYSSNYWINDPWMYRLPYAPPGYVWIRYWNDALLVDTWSGQVVDMIPGFFW